VHGRRYLDAVVFSVLNVFKNLSAFDERLSGDAAPVEADTSEVFAFHDCDFHAKLGGTDGGGVSAGATADNDEVVSHSFIWFFSEGKGKKFRTLVSFYSRICYFVKVRELLDEALIDLDTKSGATLLFQELEFREFFHLEQREGPIGRSSNL